MQLLFAALFLFGFAFLSDSSAWRRVAFRNGINTPALEVVLEHQSLLVPAPSSKGGENYVVSIDRDHGAVQRTGVYGPSLTVESALSASGANVRDAWAQPLIDPLGVMVVGFDAITQTRPESRRLYEFVNDQIRKGADERVLLRLNQYPAPLLALHGTTLASLCASADGSAGPNGVRKHASNTGDIQWPARPETTIDLSDEPDDDDVVCCATHAFPRRLRVF